MNAHKGARAAIVLMFAGALGVGTLAYYVKTTPGASHVVQVAPAEPPAVKAKPLDAPRSEPEKRVRVEPKIEAGETVRLPVFGDDISDMELAKAETPVPGGGDPMTFVAERIAEAAHLDGARVLGVDVRDHVAFVSFNAAVQKGMGSMEEGAFLRAMQLGFGQFADVDKVALESEGQPLESGHVDLSEPLAVIRPGEKPQPDSTHGEP